MKSQLLQVCGWLISAFSGLAFLLSFFYLADKVIIILISYPYI